MTDNPFTMDISKKEIPETGLSDEANKAWGWDKLVPPTTKKQEVKMPVVSNEARYTPSGTQVKTPFIIKKTEFTPLEPGVYEAKIVSVEVIENTFEPGTGKMTLQIGLDLGEGVQRRAYCNPSLGPKSTLARWIQALWGEVPDELDISRLVGQLCRIMVVNKTTKAGQASDRVTELLAPKKARVSPVPLKDEEELPF